MQENKYIDFQEYIRAGEPHKREKAYAWRTAIGLQSVDGLYVSDYLKQTAKRHIEGEITIDQARELVNTYYKTKPIKEKDDDIMQEADKVSANISKLLQEETFAFTFVGLLAIHKRVFEGVFNFAGQIRDYNITKKEWVLRGDTVLYVSATDIKQAVEYDLQTEKEFNYAGLSMEKVAEHIAKFVSGIWQIHPFGEGNTRTTAIFTIKYLRSLGFKVDNNLFADNAWYFRNALVRANYKNIQKGISYEPVFLIRFFRNLLIGENNELKNRYLLIEPPTEWRKEVEKMIEQIKKSTPTTTPTTTPTSLNFSVSQRIDKIFNIKNENTLRIVKTIGEEQLGIKQIMELIGLKDRKNFITYSLTPALQEGFIQMLYPDNPHHPKQKYLLTVKGFSLYNEIMKKEK
ncbi:MAG: Fic family protein [Bacteroidales bacterium]|nr:Fic family protein [Bacteroidales bacterium]